MEEYRMNDVELSVFLHSFRGGDGKLPSDFEQLKTEGHYLIHWDSERAFCLKEREIYLKTSSGVINTLFYPLIVSAKKFYATDACIGCGKCTEVCPLNNVSLKDGKPVWGDHCTHCMACICKCPKEAVEYGNRSKGKPRYQCPL